jgi:hypothetical protein
MDYVNFSLHRILTDVFKSESMIHFEKWTQTSSPCGFTALKYRVFILAHNPHMLHAQDRVGDQLNISKHFILVVERNGRQVDSCLLYALRTKCSMMF